MKSSDQTSKKAGVRAGVLGRKDPSSETRKKGVTFHWSPPIQVMFVALQQHCYSTTILCAIHNTVFVIFKKRLFSADHSKDYSSCYSRSLFVLFTKSAQFWSIIPGTILRAIHQAVLCCSEKALNFGRTFQGVSKFSELILPVISLYYTKTTAWNSVQSASVSAYDELKAL